MFSKIFSRKRIKLNRGSSEKNVTLKWKIVVGCCGGHNTIILFFSFEEYQGKLISLCDENITLW